MTKPNKQMKIIELINKGLTYRQVAKKVGLKSTNTINYYVKRFNGKRIYLTEEERLTIKGVMESLRTYRNDSSTYRITSSILSKL